MANNFSVWGFKSRLWRNNRPNATERPMYLKTEIEKDVQEPGEAVDYAEEWLHYYGVPGQSYAEVVFNGEKEPHTTVYLLDEHQLGILNSPSAMWPVFYPETGPQGNLMLSGNPWPDSETPPDGNEIDADVPEDDGFGDEDEDSRNMDLGGGDDEKTDEPESEDEPDDEGDEDNPFEDDEDDDEEEPEDEMPESESDEGDESEDETEPDEDGDDEAEEESEGDDEGESESDDEPDESEHEKEQEKEMPRLKIFAKMKGPLGWRKRAEAEELNDRNVFALKVGVLDPDEELTAAKREQDLVAHVEFVELDSMRTAGVLRIKLPKLASGEGPVVNFTKSGWMTVEVPYTNEGQ